MFRTIFAQPDADAVAATWDEVRDQLATRFPKIGPLMDDSEDRSHRVHQLPAGALAEDLVHEPARADQQGNPSVGLVDAASDATAVLTVGDRAEV